MIASLKSSGKENTAESLDFEKENVGYNVLTVILNVWFVIKMSLNFVDER